MTSLDLTIPWHLTLAYLPDLVLIAGAMVLLLWAGWRAESDRHQRAVGFAAIAVCLVTAVVVLVWFGRYRSLASGPIAIDNFRWVMDLIILLGTALAIALSIDDNRRERIPTAETHVLILFASAGMMLLAAARDLMIVFLGIELMSISVYALAALNRRSARSAEGALKYFLLGAFSTAFFLYGIALMYGATGTTNISRIALTIVGLHQAETPLVLAGLAMLLIGFGFKIAAVPFHMWAPDVYDGSPSPITAYMAATVKAAAITAFFRVWTEAFGPIFATWYHPLHFLAIATMVVGNAVGLAQRNLKRMLAYSSIGHAGYMMVAIATVTGTGAAALMFYLFVYTLATYGAFAVVSSVAQPGRGTVSIDELAGLWKERPWMALGLGSIMLALLGFPVFGGAGFFAKWYVLQAALRAPVPLMTLSVVLVLTTVLSAGYYLNVVMVMFMKPRPENAPPIARMDAIPRSILVGTVVLLFVLGLFPDQLVRVTSRARPEYGLAPLTPDQLKTITPTDPPKPR
jgi:NADH-quinone oxidoreductase subunit N